MENPVDKALFRITSRQMEYPFQIRRREQYFAEPHLPLLGEHRTPVAVRYVLYELVLMSSRDHTIRHPVKLPTGVN